jgi:hypothetical protein
VPGLVSAPQAHSRVSNTVSTLIYEFVFCGVAFMEVLMNDPSIRNSGKDVAICRVGNIPEHGISLHIKVDI